MRASRSFVLTHNLQRATYNRSQEHTPRRQEHAATPLKRGPKIKSRRAVPARCAQVLRSDARVQVLRSYPPTTSNVQPISRAHSPSAGACRHPARAGILDQEQKSGCSRARRSVPRSDARVQVLRSEEQWLVISEWWMAKSGVTGLGSGKNEIRIRALTYNLQPISRAHAPPQAVPPAQAGTKIKSVKSGPQIGTCATTLP